MDNNRTKSRREIIRRYLLFGISLMVISLGIAIITRSDLGTSPISSIPYVASLGTGLTLGTYFFLFTVFLIIIQLLLLGAKGIRQRRIELLMQFPVAILLSVFTDLSMWLLAGFVPQLYITKIIGLVIGCAVLALGICLEVIADVTMISAEYTIQFATIRFKKEFGNIKICFDVTLVVLAALLSLALMGRIEGVREGTVIAALITGPFVRLTMPRLRFVRKWLEITPQAAAPAPEASSLPLVITVSREYGSGGRQAAETIARTLGIAFYDKELITLAAEESGFSEKYISENEQRLPRPVLLQMIFQDYEAPLSKSLSHDDALFVAQSKVIRKIASCRACVIVGRCADYILKDRPNTINIFLTADMQHKISRAVNDYNIPADKAEEIIAATDRSRAEHYLHYTGRRWGDARNYSATFDTTVFPPSRIAAILQSMRDQTSGTSTSPS